jgi:predicted transcriptional regulator of viral defense system
MVLKNTILSSTDNRILESVVLAYGQVASTGQIAKAFEEVYSHRSDRIRRISFLSKAGWLVRVKKGLYVVVTDLSSLAVGDVSKFFISNALNSKSYISFANALNWHGMFDQLTKSVDAVTSGRARSYQFQNMEFRFFKVKGTLFFGYSKERADGRVVNMAEKEKVILDYLSLRRNAATLSLVFEKLKEHKDAFDFSKMTDYAKTHSLTIQRNLGFLLDAVGVSTDSLYEIVRKKKTGFSKMHANAKTFNAKWRLYYDPGVTH